MILNKKVLSRFTGKRTVRRIIIDFRFFGHLSTNNRKNRTFVHFFVGDSGMIIRTPHTLAEQHVSRIAWVSNNACRAQSIARGRLTGEEEAE